jgi:uncharacterized membrane protein (DUF106 family)
MKILDDSAQGSQMMLLMLFLLMMIFIMPTFGPILGEYAGYALEPIIGFNGSFPVLTLFFAGLIVVTCSSLLTNLFTDWKAMGKSQEVSRAFQKELNKARREGNTNKVNKLMKMQPQIMKMTTQSSSGMMKPMIFLIIIIWPIFIWLRSFLGDLPYHYFTVPWSSTVFLFDRSLPGGVWLWIYLLVSMVFGQLIRQGLKLASWSEVWQNTKGKIIPSFK